MPNWKPLDETMAGDASAPMVPILTLCAGLLSNTCHMVFPPMAYSAAELLQSALRGEVARRLKGVRPGMLRSLKVPARGPFSMASGNKFRQSSGEAFGVLSLYEPFVKFWMAGIGH